MDDLISRRAAIEAVVYELDMIDHVPQWIFDRLTRRIKELPSMRLKGKWLIKRDEFIVWDECSVCGKKVMHKAPFYNFCPNCGMDMR